MAHGKLGAVALVLCLSLSGALAVDTTASASATATAGGMQQAGVMYTMGTVQVGGAVAEAAPPLPLGDGQAIAAARAPICCSSS
jgi:hypothetical protein